ncbi:MAG: FAD-dependent monooxygenase, partial [Bacilli bacterium]|nr:FAD-dependent monooxygenase [Bacilli bacterium]
MVKEFDVIIVGCGPAGIAAAKTLLKNNVNFCMIDKAKFPRRKLCAGGLTYRSLKLLKELDLNIENIIKDRFNTLSVYYGNKKSNIKINKEIAMVDRTEFDNNNLQEIRKVCNNIFLSENIVNLDKYVLTTDKSTYKFKYIIFADGVNG